MAAACLTTISFACSVQTCPHDLYDKCSVCDKDFCRNHIYHGSHQPRGSLLSLAPVVKAVAPSKTAFAAPLVPITTLVPIKKLQATVPNTVRNMASSTDAFEFLMAHRRQASITGAPAPGIASMLIVEVANGTAPRDSSATVVAVVAVAADASPPPKFLEAGELSCPVICSLKDLDAGEQPSSANLAAITDDDKCRTFANNVAPPKSIPPNIAACLSFYNSDERKTYKELGIFYKSFSKVQYHALSITF